MECRRPRHGMGMHSTEFQKECIFASVLKNDVYEISILLQCLDIERQAWHLACKKFRVSKQAINPKSFQGRPSWSHGLTQTQPVTERHIVCLCFNYRPTLHSSYYSSHSVNIHCTTTLPTVTDHRYMARTCNVTAGLPEYLLHHHNRFTALFPGPPGCKNRTSGLYGARED